MFLFWVFSPSWFKALATETVSTDFWHSHDRSHITMKKNLPKTMCDIFILRPVKVQYVEGFHVRLSILLNRILKKTLVLMYLVRLQTRDLRFRGIITSSDLTICTTHLQMVVCGLYPPRIQKTAAVRYVQHFCFLDVQSDTIQKC